MQASTLAPVVVYVPTIDCTGDDVVIASFITVAIVGDFTSTGGLNPHTIRMKPPSLDSSMKVQVQESEFFRKSTLDNFGWNHNIHNTL